MKDIYLRRNFLDFVTDDAGIFLNVWEFARVHFVNGHEVISVLVSDKHQKFLLNENENIISQKSMKFYVKQEDISGIMPGQSVRIDDDLYLVQGVHDIQGVMWAVDLLSYSG